MDGWKPMDEARKTTELGRVTCTARDAFLAIGLPVHFVMLQQLTRTRL
jgi:hypothetical protein